MKGNRSFLRLKTKGFFVEQAVESFQQRVKLGDFYQNFVLFEVNVENFELLNCEKLEITSVLNFFIVPFFFFFRRVLKIFSFGQTVVNLIKKGKGGEKVTRK